MNSKTWTRIITTVAIAVGALLMSPLAFVPTAAAEVVYTPVNVTLSGTGSIKARKPQLPEGGSLAGLYRSDS